MKKKTLIGSIIAVVILVMIPISSAVLEDADEKEETQKYKAIWR
jgi:hypothetical protein